MLEENREMNFEDLRPWSNENDTRHMDIGIGVHLEDLLETDEDDSCSGTMAQNPDNTVDIPQRKPIRKIPRNQSKRHGKKETVAVSPKSLTDAWSTKCCAKDCMSKLSVDIVKEHRGHFWKKTCYEQSLFINSQLRTVFRYKEEMAHEVMFTVDGCSVCSKCWCLVYKISRSRYYSHQRAVRSVMPVSGDERFGKHFDTARYLQAKLWLEKFSSRYGDRMPHKCEIQLPSCMTKTHVFNMYRKEKEEMGKKPLGRSRFFELWKSHFSSVKILKSKDFTKCSQCILFQDALGKKLSKDRLMQVQTQREAHLSLQRLLREKYYKHCEKARDNPQKYVSIIIDNMDQNKSNLPVFPEQSKSDAGLAHVKHQITGVLDHGNNKAHGYIWSSTMSGDSNITCTVLLDVLSHVARNYEGSLPETLYLQCDNSRKDNKNQTVFNFLASLVKRDIFKKVKVSFLMVGHTHEDVDQMFSTFSQALHREPAPTVPALEKVLQKAYTPTPATSSLKSVWDYRQLFKDEDHFVGHSDPHVFVIRKRGNDVIIKYKDWPLRNEEYRSIIITPRANLADLVVVPAKSTEVQIVQDAMIADLPKWVRSTRLSHDDAEWWTKYLSSLFSPPEPDVHPLHFSPYIKTVTFDTCPETVVDALAQEELKRKKRSQVTVRKRRRT